MFQVHHDIGHWTLFGPWSRLWFIIIRSESLILSPWIAISNLNPDSWSSNWNLAVGTWFKILIDILQISICMITVEDERHFYEIQTLVGKHSSPVWISDMWADVFSLAEQSWYLNIWHVGTCTKLADKVSIWVYRLLPECDCSLVLCDLKQPLCIAQRNTKMPSSKIGTTCQFEMHFHIALIDVSLRNIF